MALKVSPAVGKLLYGTLFAVLLPVALICWAHGARSNVKLPMMQSVPGGAVFGAAGLLLWITGIVTLRLKGGGLPMNAFPPPKIVAGGIYAVVAHPIYIGFTLIGVGTALVCGSAAGLWLVSPMLALSASALWWGYERIDLRKRLGAPPRGAWLGVPRASPNPPLLLERAGSLMLTLAAPVLAALMLHGAGLAARPSYVLSDSGYRSWLTLVVVVAGACAARSSAGLRDLLLSSRTGTLLFALFLLLLPSGPFGGRLDLAPDGGMQAILAMTGFTALLGIRSGLPGFARWGLP